MEDEKPTNDIKPSESIRTRTINDASTTEALALYRDTDDIDTSPEVARSLR
jgi:hypothetical protein